MYFQRKIICSAYVKFILLLIVIVIATNSSSYCHDSGVSENCLCWQLFHNEAIYTVSNPEVSELTDKKSQHEENEYQGATTARVEMNLPIKWNRTIQRKIKESIDIQ